MRNLKIILDKGIKTEEDIAVTSCCIDSTTQRLLVCTTTLKFIVYDLARGEVILYISLLELIKPKSIQDKKQKSKTKRFADEDESPPLSDEEPEEPEPLEDSGRSNLDPDDEILSLQYLPELEDVVLVSQRGVSFLLKVQSLISRFHNIHREDTEESMYEVVGNIPGGVQAASWSPDQEVCVLITNQFTIIVLTKTWDILYEVPIDKDQTDSFGQEPIQAHLTTVSWRGDGQYFVTNSFHPKSGIRKLRVWNRDCQLQSSSETFQPFIPSSGASDEKSSLLSGVVTWRPEGNLIASNLITNKKQEVIFFERNGLRHGQFTLPQSEGSCVVTDLQWNADSDLLAALRLDESGHYLLEIWYMANYHWYRKYAISCGALESERDGKVNSKASRHGSRICWDPEDSMRLAIITSRHIRWLEFSWVTTVSGDQTRTCAVVDGSQLLLTPLKNSLMPPPYAVATLETGAQIVHLSFSSHSSQSEIQQKNSSTPTLHLISLLVTHFNGNLELIRLSPGSLLSPLLTPSLLRYPLSLASSSLNNHRLETLLDDHTQISFDTTSNSFSFSILLVETEARKNSYQETQLSSESGKGDTLVELHYTIHLNSEDEVKTSSTATEKSHLTNKTRARHTVLRCQDNPKVEPQFFHHTNCPSDAHVCSLFPHRQSGYVAVHLTNGQVLKYFPVAWKNSSHGTDDHTGHLINMGALPVACPHFAVARFNQQDHFIGRDSRNKLYVDQILLSPQCLSFALELPPIDFSKDRQLTSALSDQMNHALGRGMLMFTVAGAQNAMFFLDLNLDLEQNLTPQFRSDPCSVRFVERGSVIVATIPDAERPRVVLQMPRGNLEAVYPRFLSLKYVNYNLAHRDYRSAFLNMRTNRIDLNLLYDHHPQDFLKNAERVVRQLADPEYINLFLSSLNNEDVTKTVYPNYQALPTLPDVDELKIAENKRQDHEYESLAKGLAGSSDLHHHPSLEKQSSQDRGDEHDDVDVNDIGSDAFDHSVVDSKKKLEKEKEKAVKSWTPSSGKQNPTGKGQQWDPYREEERRRKKAEYLSHKTQLRDLEAEAERQEQKEISFHQKVSLQQRQAKESNKVNLVCDAVRDELITVDPERYVLCAITTYVKKQPPELVNALTLVQRLRQKSTSGEKKVDEKARVTPTEALKYAIFLADVDALINEALGIYDFELVIMLLPYSKRDPKEYLPLLQHLNTLAGWPHFQRYSIDLHLKRYPKALSNLCLSIARTRTLRDGDKDNKQTDLELVDQKVSEYWNLILKLAEEHKIYRQALSLLPPPPAPSKDETTSTQSEQTKQGSDNKTLRDNPVPVQSVSELYRKKWVELVESYGDYLFGQRQFSRSATLYCQCGRLNKALNSYKKAGDWRSCMSTAFRLKFNPTQLQSMAAEVAEVLEDAGRTFDAVTVLTTYAKDLNQAVALLLKAMEWDECLRLLCLNQREDMVKTVLVPTLIDTCTRLIQSLTRKQTKYVSTVRRLRLIRRMRLMALFRPNFSHPILSNPNDELAKLLGIQVGDVDAADKGGDDHGESDFQSRLNQSTHTKDDTTSLYSLSSLPSSYSLTSTVSSASSMFTVRLEGGIELSRKEKQQIKKKDRIRRKLSRKRVKEGHPLEEEHLISEIQYLTPTPKLKDEVHNLAKALLHFGVRTRVSRLMAEYNLLLQEVAQEELRPMPLLNDMSKEQKEKVTKFWNWPNLCYPSPVLPIKASDPPQPPKLSSLFDNKSPRQHLNRHGHPKRENHPRKAQRLADEEEFEDKTKRGNRDSQQQQQADLESDTFDWKAQSNWTLDILGGLSISEESKEKVVEKKEPSKSNDGPKKGVKTPQDLDKEEEERRQKHNAKRGKKKVDDDEEDDEEEELEDGGEDEENEDPDMF